MKEYITRTGDQWDMIAKRVYGNELLADILMEKNPHLLDIFQFDAGVAIKCPDMVMQSNKELPPWRK